MNQNAKTKRGFPYVTLILAVTIVLVVAILGYSLVNTIGIISHFNTAATSENFKINENIVDVYRYLAGSEQMGYYYSQLYQYLYIYGDSAVSIINSMDQYGTFLAYVSAGASYSQYVHDHIAMLGPGSFDTYGYTYARQFLTYCEGAREAGLYDQYKAETADDIDEVVANLKEIAKKDMGISFSNFLKKHMGNGVSEKDLREALEYQYVAVKYAEKLNDDYLAATTQEEIDKYVEENMSSFYTSKYYSYTLADEKMKTAIEKCKTVEEVKTAIADYYIEKSFDTNYKKYVTDKKVTDPDKTQTKADIRTTVLAMAKVGDNKEVFKSTDKDDYKAAAYSIAKALYTDAKLSSVATSASSAAYADPAGKTATDLQKWLFDAGRKVGDYKLIETKSTSQDSTTGATTTKTSYTWYIVEEVMLLDEEITRDAFYVKLTDDASTVEDGKTAAEKAQAMYDALKDIKDKDEFAEKLAELCETYAPTATTTEQTMLKYDTLKSTDKNLADWIFNTLRKEGDLAILPLSKEDKEKEDAAQDEADKKNETEAETDAATDSETDGATDPETDGATEPETDAATDKATETSKETETGSSTATKTETRYLVFYVEENDKTWIENGRTGVAGEKLNDWFEEHVEKYNVVIDGAFDTSAYTEAETEAPAKETGKETTKETVAATSKETEANS